MTLPAARASGEASDASSSARSAATEPRAAAKLSGGRPAHPAGAATPLARRLVRGRAAAGSGAGAHEARPYW